MKEDFSLKTITKNEAKDILINYHYLSNISKGFKSGFNYGLFHHNKLVGVIIFTGFPVPELAKGMFGLNRNEQSGLFELSRLCLHPDLQKTEHNLASFFVGRAVKQLRKDTEVKVILSYADSSFHSGIVYRACNFKYYGLSAKRKDFWIEQEDGSFIKHSRGKTKGVKGEWRDRTQKHRYVLLYDKNLQMKWVEQDWNNKR